MKKYRRGLGKAVLKLLGTFKEGECALVQARKLWCPKATPQEPVEGDSMQTRARYSEKLEDFSRYDEQRDIAEEKMCTSWRSDYPLSHWHAIVGRLKKNNKIGETWEIKTVRIMEKLHRILLIICANRPQP